MRAGKHDRQTESLVYPPALIVRLLAAGYTTVLVLLALGGVAARCLYAPDANGHVVVPEGVTSIGDSSFNSCDTLLLSRRARRGSPCCCA